MASSSSKSNDLLFNYLANIAEFGKICSVKDVSLFKQPLIAGRIVEKLPIVRKSKYQITKIQIIHLEEVFSLNKNDPQKFKVLFVGDIVELFENLCLEEGDNLAFCNVKLSPVAVWKSNHLFFPKQIVVGIEQSNYSNNIFYKRKNMVKWVPFKNNDLEIIKSQLTEPQHEKKDASSICVPYHDSSNEGGCSSTGIGCVTTTTVPVSAPTITDVISVSTTSTTDGNSIQKYQPKKDSLISCSPESVRSNLINENQNSSTFKSCEKIPKINYDKSADTEMYQYVKLSQVQKNSKVNVYGIIRRIIKKPTLTNNNKYHLIINMIDDTKTDEFFVNIFANSLDAFPKIQPYWIIRLHRLHVEEFNGRTDGRVFHGRDVLVFNKDNINETYSTAKKFTLTESDKKKVEKLKEWALEYLPDFRPFTPLHSLKLQKQKINLFGKISCMKIFEDTPVIVLRMKDESRCSVPCQRFSLNASDWSEVLTNPKSLSAESEEVDVVVTEPDKNFKELEVGDKIELINIDVTVSTLFEKTKATNYIQLFMKGSWENLRMKESHVKVSPILKNLKNSKTAFENVKKRKLFDPDVPNNFEIENHGVELQIGNENRLENNIENVDGSENENNKAFHTDRQTNVSPVLMQNIAEKVTHQLSKENFSRSPEKVENYLTKWPQPPSEDAFNIRVNLSSTTPSITEDSNSQLMLSIVRAYCSECQEFLCFHEVKWIEVECNPVAICKHCQAEGHFREMNFVLSLELVLLDQCGEPASAIILGKHAEDFFGCTVDDFCSSEEVRIAVKNKINSFIYRVGKEKKPLIVGIFPIQNENLEIVYHIRTLKPDVS